VPSLYLLNAAGLAKPHAIEHIAAELTSNGTDVAIITETHFKTKHADGVLNIPGYTLYRRAARRRRGYICTVNSAVRNLETRRG